MQTVWLFNAFPLIFLFLLFEENFPTENFTSTLSSGSTKTEQFRSNRVGLSHGIFSALLIVLCSSGNCLLSVLVMCCSVICWLAWSKHSLNSDPSLYRRLSEKHQSLRKVATFIKISLDLLISWSATGELLTHISIFVRETPDCACFTARDFKTCFEKSFDSFSSLKAFLFKSFLIHKISRAFYW